MMLQSCLGFNDYGYVCKMFSLLHEAECFTGILLHHDNSECRGSSGKLKLSPTAWESFSYVRHNRPMSCPLSNLACRK